MTEKKHVWVVGLDKFNKGKLEKLPQAGECEFHAALDISDIRDVEQYDMKALIDKAIGAVEEHPEPPDAVCAFYDFPATDLVPILAERFDLPGPSLESVLKCEHKYWSRLEQREAVPDHIPRFAAFDPFDDEAYDKLPLSPPFWIKPFKSFRGFLAYLINDQNEFEQHVGEIREKIGFIGEPFRYLFENFDLPREFVEMNESCIAESVIGGSQCTLEGYVFDGDVVIYGVVDSVRSGGRQSFSRYEYPSGLPQEIQFRMADVTRRAIQQVGLDYSPFNIEFFWDQTADEVWLLEINPRISQAHTDMFEKVHGRSHHQVMLDIALGQHPATLELEGEFPKAANFMMRMYEPGVVQTVPSADELAGIAEAVPGTEVKIRVREGDDLAQLQGQDSYSYELANIFIGGENEADLCGKYHTVLQGLTFEIREN